MIHIILSNRPTQWRLGIGINKLTIIIESADKSTSGSYSIVVNRLSRNKHAPSVIDTYRVCDLVQECDMAYDYGRRCGLLPNDKRSWQEYQIENAKLQLCKNTNENGCYY